MAFKKDKDIPLNNEEQFTKDLIKDINDSAKEKIAYNLTDPNPTDITYFIPTGSVLLDYAVSNRILGGIPAGRLTEIYGMESTGKSLIAQFILKNTQKMGGVAVFIDTENATSIDLLKNLGVNIEKLIYLQPNTIEEVFTNIEKIVLKVTEKKFNKPITIVWDSVAATPSKAELEGDYDQTTIGLSARVISKSMKKIIQLIGQRQVTLVFINQLRHKIGAPAFAEQMTTPGGKAIPFHASVRIKIEKDGKIKNQQDEIIGVGVKATVVKNKVSAPFRSCGFNLLFGVGIFEDEQIFEQLETMGQTKIDYQGTPCLVTFDKGQWCKMIIKNEKTNELIVEQQFRKKDFAEKIMSVPEYKELSFNLLQKAQIRKYGPNDISQDDIVNDIIGDEDC